jgi:protoheme IX farnesyltransferase
LQVLVKLRLNVFVLLTAFFGYLVGVMAVGSGWDLSVAMTLVHTLVGTAAAAFGASVFNQLMEIREDSRMRRTANRPLPSARMLPTSAFVLGWVLSAFGIIHLGAMVGKDAAYLAGITIATYVFIYTPMKRRTSANTLVGAIPGALPPLIGWVAAGGGLWDPRGWFLFALLFLWQLPHFVSINWLCREDYEEAGYVMWSDGDVSGARSGRLAAYFCFGLAALGPWAVQMGMAGWLFGVTALLAGLGLAGLGFRFAKSGERPAFRKFFLLTLLYLPVVLTALAIDWK